MTLNFFKPKSSLLKDFIEGYYFLRNDNSKESLCYYTFPNNYQIVSVLQHNKLGYEKNAVNVCYSENHHLISNLTCRYTRPIKVNYNGKINEITIYFKPLGLNCFLENHISFTNKDFFEFLPFPDYESSMAEVLNTQNIEKAIIILEKYWEDKFLNKNNDLMKNILNDITELKIDEIATKYNISRQYIHKLFKINLGKSPIEYKRIQRFRNSLLQTDKKLVEKGLSADFYDQSHFIRELKNFTNLIPKDFYENMSFKTSNPWLII